MKLSSLIFFLLLVSCQNKKGIIEIWGDNNYIWSMEAKKPSDEILFRVSDDPKDTLQFKIYAKNWIQQ